MKYVIQNTEEPDLFWSNEDGWCDRQDATQFTAAERGSLRLPIDGRWFELPNNPRLFLASVLFTVKEVRRTIEALVMAVDEQDAIRSAMDAVRSLYPDAEVLGGMLEPLDDALDATEAPDARGLTAPTVPASRTVH